MSKVVHTNEFGRRLYAAMRKRNMTQQELAGKLGHHYNVVGTWTRGNKTPSLKNLIELADVLDISLDQLCGIKCKATGDETEQLRKLAIALIEDTREIYGELQALNKHARQLERWARKYKLLEDEDEAD